MHSRADFLASGTLAAIGATTGRSKPAATPSPPASISEPPETIPPLAFDLAAFDARTTAPAAHRHLFAATKMHGGEPLGAVDSTQQAYKLIGVPITGVMTAMVLYHGTSIMMAFDDAVWRTFFVPALPHFPPFAAEDVAAYTAAKGNPLRTAMKPDDASMESLAATGTMFFVCNNAAKGFAHLLGATLKKPPLDVYHEMVAGLLPGASLVPAGVWAIHALQERRFTYLQTTI
jgi:intracellular sulfur oxidation DsrE/DsrF family protein